MTKKAINEEFNLVGQLKGLVFQDGYKLKYLRLEVEDREYLIKVRKEQRSQFEQLKPEGIQLKVTGEVNRCHKTGKITLKADDIQVMNPSLMDKHSQEPKNQTACILICQKSSCWKQGGAAIYAELTENLAKCGLSDQVKIKTTGCLKKCKSGPNLVFMPDRAHYNRVSCQEVPKLLAAHIQKNLVTI
jgi:(2Fe-2S) ferredoxin